MPDPIAVDICPVLTADVDENPAQPSRPKLGVVSRNRLARKHDVGIIRAANPGNPLGLDDSDSAVDLNTQRIHARA